MKKSAIPVKEQPRKDIIAVKKKLSSVEIDPAMQGGSSVILGTRYKCFGCSTKFYDLGRPESRCPFCGLSQNNENKGNRRKKRKRNSSLPVKADPLLTAPMESGEIEVVSEADAGYAFDMDDLVLEEQET
jgi:hypothetical protein